MHIGDMFCAYGVLCHLHATEFGKEWQGEHDPKHYYGMTYLPPNEIWRWLGEDSWKILQAEIPSVDRISDNCMTLSEAADEIEKKIKRFYPNFFEEDNHNE